MPDLEELRWQTLAGSRAGSALARSAAIAQRERGLDMREEQGLFNRDIALERLALDKLTEARMQRSTESNILSERNKIYNDELAQREKETKVALSEDLTKRLLDIGQGGAPWADWQYPHNIGTEDYKRRALQIMMEPKYSVVVNDPNSVHHERYKAWNTELEAIAKQRAADLEAGRIIRQGPPQVPGYGTPSQFTSPLPGGVTATYKTPEGVTVTEEKITARDARGEPTESVTRRYTEGGTIRRRNADQFINGLLGQ